MKYIKLVRARGERVKSLAKCNNSFNLERKFHTHTNHFTWETINQAQLTYGDTRFFGERYEFNYNHMGLIYRAELESYLLPPLKQDKQPAARVSE